jgi:hypothetical protein
MGLAEETADNNIIGLRIIFSGSYSGIHRFNNQQPRPEGRGIKPFRYE